MPLRRSAETITSKSCHLLGLHESVCDLSPMRHGEETQRYLHGFKNEAYRGMSRKTVGCDWTSQIWSETIRLIRDADSHERPLAITKDYEMGDKGGKKDKEKSKKQNADKQEQKSKGKQAKPQSK